MLPLLAIGGVIGALFSIGKGAQWVADQVAPSDEGSASADKSAAAPQSEQAAAFSAALAAQGAGQTVPSAAVAAQAPSLAVPAVSSSSSIIGLPSGTGYDTLARVQAGIAAYGKIGEGHGAHNGNDATPSIMDGDSTARKTSSISAP